MVLEGTNDDARIEALKVGCSFPTAFGWVILPHFRQLVININVSSPPHSSTHHSPCPPPV
jgi:hypothetical protein